MLERKNENVFPTDDIIGIENPKKSTKKSEVIHKFNKVVGCKFNIQKN